MTNEIHECELLELGAFMRRHEEFVERLASYRSSINKKYEDFTTRAAFKKLLQLQEQYVDRCEQESWRKDPSKLWEISKQYCEQAGPTWLEVSKPYDSECTRVIWTKVEPAYAPTPYLCLTPFGYPGPKVLKGEPEKSPGLTSVGQTQL